MPTYKLPQFVSPQRQPIFGEGEYTFVADFNAYINSTMPVITMTTVCGGEYVFKLDPYYGVTGDANLDPALMATLTAKVEAYMASLEVI